MASKTVKIVDEAGVHARPAAKLSHLAASFDARVELTYQGKTIDLKSIMGIMSLGIPQHAEITLSVMGDNEQNLLDDLIAGMQSLELI